MIRNQTYYYIYIRLMSSQSGSRFSSNNTYQQPSYYTPSPAPETQTNFTQNPSQNPPYSSYPTANVSVQQNQQFPGSPQGQAPVSNVEHLLDILPQQQRIKVKAQNLQKYQMNPESFIYRLTPKYLKKLVYKYPQEFAPQMKQELFKNIGNMQRNYEIFNKLFWGGILYWVALRRRTWFRLTGNGIMRVSWAFICVNNMMDIGFDLNQYMVQNAFIYNAQYEQVLQNHNINANTVNNIELFS